MRQTKPRNKRQPQKRRNQRKEQERKPNNNKKSSNETSLNGSSMNPLVKWEEKPHLIWILAWFTGISQQMQGSLGLTMAYMNARLYLKQTNKWPSISTPNRSMSIQIFTKDTKKVMIIFHLFPNIFPPQSLPAILLERWTSALKCLCKNQSLRIPSQKMTVKTSPFPMENLPTKNRKQFPSSFLLQLKKNPPCNF